MRAEKEDLLSLVHSLEFRLPFLHLWFSRVFLTQFQDPGEKFTHVFWIQFFTGLRVVAVLIKLGVSTTRAGLLPIPQTNQWLRACIHLQVAYLQGSTFWEMMDVAAGAGEQGPRCSLRSGSGPHLSSTHILPTFTKKASYVPHQYITFHSWLIWQLFYQKNSKMLSIWANASCLPANSLSPGPQTLAARTA